MVISQQPPPKAGCFSGHGGFCGRLRLGKRLQDPEEGRYASSVVQKSDQPHWPTSGGDEARRRGAEARPCILVGPFYERVVTHRGPELIRRSRRLSTSPRFAAGQRESVSALIKDLHPARRRSAVLPPLGTASYCFDKAKFAGKLWRQMWRPEKLISWQLAGAVGAGALNGAISQPAWKKASWYLVATDDKMSRRGRAVHVQTWARVECRRLKGGATRSMYPSPSRRDAHLKKQPGRPLRSRCTGTCRRLVDNGVCRRLPTAAVRRKSHTPILSIWLISCTCRSDSDGSATGPRSGDNLPPAYRSCSWNAGQPARGIFRPFAPLIRLRPSLQGRTCWLKAL